MGLVSRRVRAHSEDSFKWEGNAVNTSAASRCDGLLYESVSHDKRNQNVDSDEDTRVVVVDVESVSAGRSVADVHDAKAAF